MKITDVKLTPVYSKRETGAFTPHVILQLITDEELVGLGEMSDLGHWNTKYDLRDLKESIAYLLVGRNPLDYGPLTRDVGQRFSEGGPLCEGIEIAI